MNILNSNVKRTSTKLVYPREDLLALKKSRAASVHQSVSVKVGYSYGDIPVAAVLDANVWI